MEELEFFKQQARSDIIDFSVFTDKFFTINKHHETISKALERFFKWETKRLIIQTPPRSGKTRMMSEAIAWAMWNLERKDIIYTGHSLSLLEWISRNIRTRVESPEFQLLFPKVQVKKWNESVADWMTTNNNRLMVYWVWGGITGKGGDFLIIDDPYATRQDAESETVRKGAWEWYNSTFYSRRHNENTGICMIMQRWREDDLVGEVLKQEDWEIVKIPAIDEDGVSFWPSRFSVEELNRLRLQIGDYFFQSQYQQDPINEWAGAFVREYFEYYHPDELKGKELRIMTFLDPAISTRQTADRTAIVTVGIDVKSNNIYLLNAWWDRVEPDRIIDKLFEIVLEYKPERVGIETIQYQKMLALEIRKQMTIRNRYFVLEEVKPKAEKEARIRTTLQPRYANHVIYHPKDKDESVNELENELIKFPNGKHDDYADCLASVVAMLEAEDIFWPQKVFVPDYGWLF